MSPGRYCMDADAMLELVDENTIFVVPTFGVTYTGAYEPVLELSEALDGLQRDTGLDVDIHVDGASGAFLAPFCAPEVQFDFRVPRVKSISTSGHKFGLAPLGVGWVVWRDVAELPDDLIFHVNYLGGDMPVFQINFSRPAGQIIAQYYDFVRLGREGYRRVHQASYDTGRYLAEEIVKLGPFELLCDSDPRTGIPSVAWRIAPGASPGYSLFDLADRLRVRGWQVPVLHVDRGGVRHPRAADPGPPRRHPRPRIDPARRLQGRDRPLRRASRVRGHARRGGGWLQPPLTPCPTPRAGPLGRPATGSEDVAARRGRRVRRGRRRRGAVRRPVGPEPHEPEREPWQSGGGERPVQRAEAEARHLRTGPDVLGGEFEDRQEQGMFAPRIRAPGRRAVRPGRSRRRWRTRSRPWDSFVLGARTTPRAGPGGRA